VELNGGWPVVAGTAGLVGFLDAITVVASAFYRAWTGTVTAHYGVPSGDMADQMRKCLIPVFRGKSPPYR
jgi:hypothetical protein